VTKREEELFQQGWERRFVASEPRLTEMVTLYEESGFEVLLEPLASVEDPDPDTERCQTCRICFEGVEDDYRVVFTRAAREERDPT